MKRLAVIVLLGLLSACSSGATPSQQNVVLASKNTLVAAQTLAIQYTSLPRCGAPTAPPLCSDAGVVTSIRKANADAVVALDAAEKVVRDPTATSSAINEAIAASTNEVNALQTIVANHKVN